MRRHQQTLMGKACKLCAEKSSVLATNPIKKKSEIYLGGTGGAAAGTERKIGKNIEMGSA